MTGLSNNSRSMRHHPTRRVGGEFPLRLLLCILFGTLLCVPSPSFGLSSAPPKGSAKTATIANLRYYGSPEQNRLIFDLLRPVKYTQLHTSDPNQVVINLSNAVLGRIAKRKLEEHSFRRKSRSSRQALAASRWS